MTDRSQQDAGWAPFVSGTLITIGFAVVLIWGARTYGRTVGFALGVNWILMAWAISLGRVLESRSGAWNGLSVRLPASYYATRPFEKGGRVYDYLGVLLVPAIATSCPVVCESSPSQIQTGRPTDHDSRHARSRGGASHHIRCNRRYHVVGAGLWPVGHRGMAAAV